MARIDERNPDGADGEWFIDERCICCGSSASVAPELIVRRGAKYVFDHQPDGEVEVERAWLARELCPTRSIGTETRTAKRDPYPHEEAPGVYRCGHNDRASFGAHSYFLSRPDGNLLVDSPRHTFKLARPVEQMGGLSRILLTHRDDVADAEKWAEKFDAEVTIHQAEHDAAPFATRVLSEPVTDIAEGVQAIAVPGHTEGSVVYLVDETYLFTGDSLAWSHSGQDLYAFRDATWFSWEALTASLRSLADHRFEQVFAGHGASSPRLDAAEMRRRLLALTDRMAATP
jgi:glyoxylase-like metal-dependent hydrolase (beta-lactamase superfamily II)